MLEKLLKSVKVLDEEIHRQYEKLGKRLDKKSDKARYTAGIWLDLIGEGFFGPGLQYLPRSLFHGSAIMIGSDLALNCFGLIGMLDNQKDISDTKTINNPWVNFLFKTTKLLRSPVFLTGVGVSGKGIYNIMNGLINNEPISGDAYIDLSQGLGIINFASSMYLKDRNPKLLDKKPFCKKAYDWGKEKINSLTPKPIPQPVPIKAYSGLEDYIK